MTAPATVCARLLAMPAALAAQGFVLRPENEADLPFLRRLYVSTRWEELAIVTQWSDAEKVAFLESQFGFQRHHYLTYYATTDCAILEQDGVPGGRLYGKSDAHGSAPVENPVHPIELLATIYHAFGIAPDTIVMNHLNQPRELVKAQAVERLFG